LLRSPWRQSPPRRCQWHPCPRQEKRLLPRRRSWWGQRTKAKDSPAWRKPWPRWPRCPVLAARASPRSGLPRRSWLGGQPGEARRGRSGGSLAGRGRGPAILAVARRSHNTGNGQTRPGADLRFLPHQAAQEGVAPGCPYTGRGFGFRSRRAPAWARGVPVSHRAVLGRGPAQGTAGVRAQGQALPGGLRSVGGDHPRAARPEG